MEDFHLLLNILAQGEEKMRQLEAHLGGPVQAGAEFYKELAREAKCTFQQAIAVAKAMESEASLSRGIDRTDSPRSADESPGRTSRDAQERQDAPKKRKGPPRWTNQVRVSSTSLEGTPEDGYCWRKYGQKDILGAKYPRGYYRCTYRNAQGCPAIKYVQRSDSDPFLFVITYQYVHTCQQKSRQAVAAPMVTGHHAHPMYDQNLQLLTSLKNELKVETEGFVFHDHDHDPTPSSSFGVHSDPFNGSRSEDTTVFSPEIMARNLAGGFTPAVIPPATSRSNYFSMSQCQDGSFEGVAAPHCTESELGEVISAATTFSVDPSIASFDYPLYHAEFGSHMQFDLDISPDKIE